MADNVVVRTITIRGTSEGLDKLTADLRGLATAEKDVAVVSDDLTKRQISLAAAWKATGLRLDETARAQDTFTRLSKQNTQALAQEQITAQQHAERLALLNERYGQASASATKLTAGMTAAGDVGAVASQRMVAGLSAVGKEADIAAKAMEKMAASAKPTADQAATTRLTTGMTAAGDVSAVQSQRMVAGMSSVKKAAEEMAAAANKPLSQMMAGMSAAGDIGAQASHKMVAGMSAMGKEATATAPQVDKVTVSQAALTKQSSRNAAEMLNLGRQFADVAVSMQAGQSILVVGLQQGAQIIDVIASSNRSMGQIAAQAATWAGRFVTSTAGVITGITAIGAAAVYAGMSWQDGQREIDRALIGVGKRAGLTRDEINQMADTTAKSSRLSSSELRGTALELIKTGTIYGENIGKINSLTEGFAIQTGQSAQEAGKALAEIFGGDIVQGADKLNAIYGNLSGRMRQYIVDLDSSGQRQKAIAVLADEAGKKTKESADTIGFWARSWQLLGQAASGAFDAIGKGMTNITGIGETRLAALQTRLNFLNEGLKEQEQRSAGSGVGVDTARLERSRAAVKALTDEIARLKKESGDKSEQSVAEKIGNDADNAVRKLLPFVEQLEIVRKAQKEIAKAEATPGANQGLAQYNKQARDAGMVREIETQNAMDSAARLNAYKVELLQWEKLINKENASTNLQFLTQMDTLERELPVAGAIGQMAQIEAQHRARIAELSITMAPAEATRLARAEAIAKHVQIEAQHRQTMVQLRGQTDVAGAVGAIAQINAQYEATVNSLKLQIGLSRALQQAEEQRAAALAAIESAHQVTMVAMQGQLTVAQQVGGLSQINAQHEATVANLTLQIGLEKAIAQADAQRAIALAQVNAEADRMLIPLRQERELIRASSEEEKERIKARHTYNDLIQKGVDAERAQLVASKQLNNAQEQRNKAQQQAAETGIANVKTATDAWGLYQQGVVSWSVANDEAGKANVRNQQQATNAMEAQAAAAYNVRHEMDLTNEAARVFTGLLTNLNYLGTKLGESFSDVFSNLREGKDIWTTGGQVSQFNPAGSTSQTAQTQNAIFMGASLYGEGGYSRDMTNAQFLKGFLNLMPNAKGLEKVVDDAMSAGFDPSSGILSGLASQNAELVQSTAGILSRMTSVLPDERKAGFIQEQLNVLQGATPTLARAELIMQLNQQLEQLKQATEDNTSATSAMTDVLSPFYSSDPRRTHLGFRAFAGGGIMSQYGELPIRHYQSGGMANSPQVAVFGEGSTPEAYVPVPSGRIPVELKQPANSNQKQRPVNVTINVMGSADSSTVQALKSTAFQQAQAMRRMMG